MKRLLALLMALAGLTALFAGCGGGGEEEVATLAVAFRLDAGSPLMSAYIGDPTEDPWQLPAGRYYIEAVDQDDVLLSLGTVDIEDGDVVEFPPSFEAAGGVADPQRAEPLITLASFLVDVELAKYKFLEIVTAGFIESPFGSAVEPDVASVQQLFEAYGEIAAQEDDVLAALSQIESRVGVSSGASYVCSSWAFAPDDLDRTEIQVAFLVALLIRAQQMGEAADSPAEACQEGACWVIPLQGEGFDVRLTEQMHIEKTPEMLAMFNKWQEYAGKLVQDLGLTPDKTSPGQAQKGLMEKVKSDLRQKWGADAPPDVIDEVADFFVNEVTKAVPELASAPAGGPAQAKADTSWIEGFVQKVAERLLDQGHNGKDVAVWADDLKLCLTAHVEQGLSQEDATAMCVWYFDCVGPTLVGVVKALREPLVQEPSEAEPQEPAEPEPEEPSEPEPEEPSEPEPEEPSEPEPEDVTAVGQYTRPQPPGYVVVNNTMTLTFNTAGGIVKGDGEKDLQTPDDQGCGTGMIYGTYKYEGTYYPETSTFEGTFTVVGDGYFMSQSSDCDFVDGELVCECKSVGWGDSFSGDWQATLENGVVKGSQTVQVDAFELTVWG